MQTVRDPDTLAATVAQWRREAERVALVPTMGALHDGHLALVAEARRRADRVVVSIFVNPLQFNDKDDLARYPRQEAEDGAKLKAAGADLLWLPTAAQFYPDGYATTVSVKGVSDRWEGAHRPGHFNGVATVVAKLFIGAGPDVAIFGEKDFQQLAVIRRMAKDLGLAVEVVGYPTVRAEDGLALSSRNALLSADEREAAVALPDALNVAALSIAGGGNVDIALGKAVRSIQAAGFGPVDYVAYVDPDTLDRDRRNQIGIADGVVDTSQRQAMPVDQDQRRVAGAGAETMDRRRVGARTIGAAESSLAGTAKPGHCRDGLENLLRGLCIGRFDIATTDRDEVGTDRRDTADRRARHDDVRNRRLVARRLRVTRRRRRSRCDRVTCRRRIGRDRLHSLRIGRLSAE